MASSESLTLGEFLRQERERRGLTIEQVASATKIGVRLLHSLESDHYSDLPARPFVRGFVTSYARFIGLDPSEVLTRFGNYIDDKAHDRPNRDAGHSGYAFEKREGEQSRTILSLVMVGFIIFGGVLIFILKPTLKQRRGSHVEKLRAVHVSPTASAQPEETVSATPQPSPGAVALLPPEPSPSFSESVPDLTTAETRSKEEPKDPLNSGLDLNRSDIKHKVIFKAKESTWIRYRCDDRKDMQFVLKEGKILVLRAKERIIAQVANPLTVTFNYNGGGERSIENSENSTVRQDDVTLFFPRELSETIQEPFPDRKPLKTNRPPRSSSSPSVSTSTP